MWQMTHFYLVRKQIWKVKSPTRGCSVHKQYEGGQQVALTVVWWEKVKGLIGPEWTYSYVEICFYMYVICLFISGFILFLNSFYHLSVYCLLDCSFTVLVHFHHDRHHNHDQCSFQMQAATFSSVFTTFFIVLSRIETVFYYEFSYVSLHN